MRGQEGGSGGRVRWLIGRRHDHVNRAMQAMHGGRVGVGGCSDWSRKIWRGVGHKGKDGFVECDMARNINATSLYVKTTTSFVRIRVTEEYAGQGTRGELVGGCGANVWKTEAAKNA